ncbi:polysaccharide deacetylase family protein [Comamonadaceae bacterium G21597-S1]|nr:polysaccharide deacetylase family protein [Comamonadaceae bacterium G21597-S1]
MLKQVFQWLSPSGARARLSVLIFHRVLPSPDPLFPDEIDARRFDEICGWVGELCNVLPLDHAVLRLQAGTLPARAACITFDDGYGDNYQVALPILKRHGLSATFFVSTGYLDGGCMWNDAVIEAVRRTHLSSLDLDDLIPEGAVNLPVASVADKAAAIDYIIKQLKYRPDRERAALITQVAGRAAIRLPTDLMMTSQEVRAMRSAGMLIGAHTVSHPILAALDADAARFEMQQSKKALENLLGERVAFFAYPNGKPVADYSSETVAIVRDVGFDAALSTRWAAARADTDLYQIPRFTPWDRSPARFGMRLIANLRAGHT